MENAAKRSAKGHARVILGAGLALALVLFALPPAAYMKWVDWPWLGPAEHVRLAAYEGDVGALEWIAKDFGFYEKAGVEVDIKGYASGKEAIDALQAGQADIATASEFVVATEAFARPDLRILSSVSYYWNKGIIGRHDRGISVPADLRSKRIGVTMPSGAEYSLSVFLALNRMSVNDVTLVNLPPKQLVKALLDGDIDAAITWQPHVQNISSALGANAAVFGGEGFDVYLLLATLADKAPERERATRRLLRALVMAETWAQTHPDEAKAYIAKRFGLEAAYAEAQWRRMRLAVNLPQEILVAMDGEGRWLAQRDGKAEAAIPNYAQFIRPDELRAVKPAAVTILSDSNSPRNGFKAAAVRQ